MIIFLDLIIFENQFSLRKNRSTGNAIQENLGNCLRFKKKTFDTTFHSILLHNGIGGISVKLFESRNLLKEKNR